MSNVDYHAPVKYEPPPPPRSGWPPWGIALAACGVLVVIGGVALALLTYSVFSSVLDTGDIDEIPPARVQQGKAPAWRELGTWPLGNGVSMLEHLGAGPQTADTNGDGREELLVAVEARRYPPARLMLQLDGTSLGDPLPDGRVMGAVPTGFDYDADGVDELAMYADEGQIGIYDVGGTRLASLAGYSTAQDCWPQPDIDGNGIKELLISEQPHSGALIAYGSDGPVWTSEIVQDCWYSITVGDVDGDGLDEVITLGEGQQLTVLGLNQSPATLPQIGQYCSKIVCLDVTGDGTPELIEPASGYTDPVTRNTARFSWPGLKSTLLGGYHFDQDCQVAVCDLTGDGQREVVISGSPYDDMNPIKRTAIYAFDQTGRLVYREELGEKLRGITTVMDGSTAHLAVQTLTRLLVYP